MSHPKHWALLIVGAKGMDPGARFPSDTSKEDWEGLHVTFIQSLPF